MAIEAQQSQLRELVSSHLPLVIGAFLFLMVMSLLERCAHPQGENLMVMFETSQQPAADIRIFNDTGSYRRTDQDGVVYNVPSHWSRPGAQLKVLVDGKIYVVVVREFGLVTIPDGVQATTTDSG